MAEEAQSDTPEEVERGESKPGSIITRNPWGCLIYPTAIGALVYGLYRFAIWIGFAGSAGL